MCVLSLVMVNGWWQVGYPETTPVAIVEKASTPDQRTLVGDLRTIATVAAEANAKPPAVIVVGEVRRSTMTYYCYYYHYYC